MPTIPTIINEIINIIFFAGIVQGFYSAFLLTHTKLRNPANNYLAILLVILSISIIHSVFAIPYFSQYHNTTFHIKEPLLLLVVPFLWFYVKKLSEPDFKFCRKHFLHFIPFLIVLVCSILLLTKHSETSDSQRFYSYTFVVNIILYIIAVGQYVFYMVYILRLIGIFKQKALNELSNTEYIDPTWLRIFLFTFFAVFLMLVLMMVIAIHKLEVTYFNQIVSLIFALAIYVLGYKGLFQQTLISREIEIPSKIIESTDKEATPIQLDDQLLKKLIDFMKSSKPFSDPELTLTSLALQLEMGRNQLSELINKGTEGNFYDFVNKYRVEEVKQLMENSKYKDYTILAIAYEAGFPSKSTFNSIFKKFTGLTPSEYRNRL